MTSASLGPGRLRVGYTIEQCWHKVPGGTAVAAIELARAMAERHDVELIGVAGRHDGPAAMAPPTSLPVRTLAPRSSAALYARWLWTGGPRLERATGTIDVAHATSIIVAPTKAPLVVTVHDLAFVRYPELFTRWGRMLFDRSLSLIRRRASLVLCSSQATMDDCQQAGIASERLRLVPLGVVPAIAEAEPGVVARRLGLPERYLLFVGTLEPRKNLARLVEAVARLDRTMTLAVVGPSGWGAAVPARPDVDVRFLGAVSTAERDALYAGAAAVVYPSLWEGFGLPVLEAMAAGAPVVTSAGISTAEVAGGAAVLVEPTDPSDIARGITEALERRADLVAAGRARAGACTWAATATAVMAAYREAAR
jgi:glycosyltransferase involved in cell wall biosynthesis